MTIRDEENGRPMLAESPDLAPHAGDEPSSLPEADDREAAPPWPPVSTPGYQIGSFVRGWLKTHSARIPRVQTTLTWADRLGRWRVRWGLDWRNHKVSAGLYVVGSPDEYAPVLVTGNARTTFDVLRSALSDADVWLLVLDTGAVDVWSAACSGTFGAGEVARQVRLSGIENLVSHRMLLLPQLSAAGLTSEEVRKECGFSAIFGPVRASDIKAFLAAGNVAEPSMRRVSFTLKERLALIPAELTRKIRPSRWVLPALFLAAGVGPGVFSFGGAIRRGVGAVLAYVLGILAGSVLTPLLLPRLPGRAFSYKGALTGAAAALLAVILFWSRLGWSDCFALLPAVAVTSSHCAVLFTRATTFTSPSGVEKEMRQALKYQAGGLLFAALLWIGSRF